MLTLNTNNLAPYLTLGYHPDITTRFGLFGEVGAAYVGKADVKVSGTNGVEQTTIDAVQQEVDSRDNKWWPNCRWRNLPLLTLSILYTKTMPLRIVFFVKFF